MSQSNWTLLEQLCALHGVSGDEDAVRRFLTAQIDGHCSWRIDQMGNLICEKKGRQTPAKKLMISAHMDEVGMMVTEITEDGYLKFTTIGGIDQRVVLGRAVRLCRSGLVGVIGTKAMHQQSAEERGKAVSISQLVIDIGACSKEEAEQHVTLGDTVAFESAFEVFGDGFLKAKALDDRAGCMVLVQLLQEEAEYDFTATFVVQEEVGLRGAKTAAYTVNPDVAIVLETTTAADISGVSGEKQVCKLGEGAVVGFMDRATIYPREQYAKAFALAKAHDIPCQTKTMVAGGNDAGAIHTTRGGVPTLAVSFPCRYLHSATCVIQQKDYDSVLSLTRLLAEEFVK